MDDDSYVLYAYNYIGKVFIDDWHKANIQLSTVYLDVQVKTEKKNREIER